MGIQRQIRSGDLLVAQASPPAHYPLTSKRGRSLYATSQRLAASDETTHARLREQAAFARRVIIPTAGGFQPQRGHALLAVDVQYVADRAHVAGHLFRWPDQAIGTWVGEAAAPAEYAPGFLCFREGPPLAALADRLRAERVPTPELILVDGHGLAHPRRAGVACWLGVVTGIATVGCAKQTLLRYEGVLAPSRGSTLPIQLGGQTVGWVVRTRERVRPVFVSPGHLVAVETCVRIVLELARGCRVPEPLRVADQACRARARGHTPPNCVDLGPI